MEKLSSNEASSVFSIYNTRHNTKEVLLILPWCVGLLFSLIGVPIISVCCELPLVWDITLFMGLMVLPTLILLLRRKLIFKHFFKETNIEDKVEISYCASELFAVNDADRVFMFPNSTNEPLIIYNWFNGLGILKDGKLKMTALVYDNRASNFLAVDMDDLYISDDVSASFEKETAQSLRFSDVDEHGRIVNVRLYARVTGMLKG